MIRLSHATLFLLTIFFAHSLSATPAGFTIAGTVIDSITSQPLSNAEVSLSLIGDNEHSLSYVTAPDGHFIFSNLPLGKFQLSATRRGYTSQSLDQHGTFSTAVIVGPGLDTEHVRFRLAPGAIITGTITDDSGDPIREAAVFLLRQDLFSGSRKFQIVNRQQTDDLGHYRFAHLQPGNYTVAVSAHPWFTQTNVREETASLRSATFDVVYPITYYSNAHAISDATKLTLGAGAIQSADFSLHAVPSVHLFVQVPNRPVVEENSHNVDGSARTNPDPGPRIGVEYNFTGGNSPSEQTYVENYEPTRTEVSPGLVEISGLRPNAAFIETASSSKAGREEESGMTLQPVQLSQTTQINLDSNSVLDVRGSLVIDNPSAQKSAPGSQPFNSDVLLFKSTQTGKFFLVSLDAQGAFSLANSPIEPGPYELTISDGDKFLITSITANKTTSTGNVITLSTGLPTTLTIHANQADCTVKGVAFKNGKPLAGAMLVLVPQDATQHAELFHRDQSDSDGSFTLSPIFPGKYTLLALENGWDLEWANPAVLFKYLPQGTPLTLTPTATLTLKPQVQ